MNKLENKVVVITGANSGIGLATAKLFLKEGAKVVVSGRRQAALDEVAKALEGDFITVKADVSIPADNVRLIKEAKDTYGNIDVLFLNAGVNEILPVSEVTEEHYDNMFNTNVKGPILATKEALPNMNDGGVILFTNSIANKRGFDGMGVYSATKGALHSYQRVLASEVRSRNIRVNSIAPGPIETPIYGKMGLSEEVIEEMGKGFAQQVPLGRFGAAEEVAKTALFLASDDSSFVNGVQLVVDGGLTEV